MGTFKDNKKISMLDMIKSLSFKNVNDMIVYFKIYIIIKHIHYFLKWSSIKMLQLYQGVYLLKNEEKNGEAYRKVIKVSTRNKNKH